MNYSVYVAEKKEAATINGSCFFRVLMVNGSLLDIWFFQTKTFLLVDNFQYQS